MKTMTCKQLGGACNKEFQANIFEEISEMSKNHGNEVTSRNASVVRKYKKRIR